MKSLDCWQWRYRCLSLALLLHMHKDGNGDPIPDSPRGILPLGDGDGGELIPTGMELVELLSPSGMAGTGMVPWSPTPIPASRPVKQHHRPGHVCCHVYVPVCMLMCWTPGVLDIYVAGRSLVAGMYQCMLLCGWSLSA